MADLSVVNVTATLVPNVTLFVADLGINQENDLIVIGVAWRASGTFTCGTGYTSAAAQQTTDAIYSEWFVKKVGASPETAPTISKTGAAATGAFIAYVIRGADVSGTAANAIDAIGSTAAGGAGGTLTSHALTTGATNTLVIHGAFWDGTNAICDPSDMNMLANLTQFCSGVTFAAATGAIPTFTFTGNTTTNTGRAWALSIKNGGGGLPTRLVDGREYIQTLGGFGTAPTNSAPNVYSTTTINGITTHNAASTLSAGQPAPLPWAVNGAALACTSSAIGADRWVGSYLSCASVNLSGKIVSFPYGFAGTVDSGRVGAEGLIIVLASSADNWVAYQAQKQSKWTPNWGQALVVEPGTTSEYDSEGSVDLTAIVAIGYLHHRVGAAAASITTYHGSPMYEGAVSKFVGGGAAGNNSVATQAMYMLGGGNNYSAGSAVYPGAVDFKGSGQLVNKFGLQLGDGATATHVVYTAQSYDIPSPVEDTWRVGAGGAGLAVKASASDTIDLRSAIITSSILQPFTIDAASSLSASLLTTGLSIIGRTFSDLAGYDWTSTSWTECDTVAFKNGDVTTCTISSPNAAVHGTTGAVCSFSANGATVTSSTINCNKASGVTGYHIALGASVTAITLNTVTLTGTPGTDKIYSALASGTLTITVDGLGTSLVAGDVTFVGGSSANAVIAAPAVYQKVIVSGFTAGSRIQIYDTTNSIELFNGTASAGDTVVSGSTATWTDPTAAAGSRAIRVRVAYVSGAIAKLWQENTGLTCGTSSTTFSITYPITQVADTTYNSNAIDGPAIYATSGITFTDAATDLVNINIAADTVALKTIYACFVYWLFTAAGIDDDVAYIDGVDPANYILTSMKIRNTSTDPLKITDGYFYDSTGSVENCVDITSPGNIYPMPAHVVPYQTTGTYAITGDISTVLAAIPSDTDNATAVLAAAAATPIASNIKKVNDITVDGNGQDATPWGPA